MVDDKEINISVELIGIDEAIEKVNQLISALREAKEINDSLSRS